MCFSFSAIKLRFLALALAVLTSVPHLKLLHLCHFASALTLSSSKNSRRTSFTHRFQLALRLSTTVVTCRIRRWGTSSIEQLKTIFHSSSLLGSVFSVKHCISSPHPLSRPLEILVIFLRRYLSIIAYRSSSRKSYIYLFSSGFCKSQQF